jgi:murein endopeptidase
MAKGQFLSPHQKGIVKRYYENKDTIATQKLGEIVSELYLLQAERPDSKKAERLWKSAEAALLNAGANKARVERVVTERDLKGLAELLNAIF